MKYIIHRNSNRHIEREVLILTIGGFSSYGMDPQREVVKATGVWIGRHHCILSFGFGLVQAGHDVIFYQPRADGSVGNYSIPSWYYDRTVHAYPAFTFIGLAWGRGAWTALSRSMRRSVHSHERWDVYLRTAHHYFQYPFEPIRWLL